MTTVQDNQISRHRLIMFCLGGIAALALWALVDNRQVLETRPGLMLALLSFVVSYFGVALALAGPLAVRRALIGALLIGVPVAGLVSLAGLRHAVATDLLDDPLTLGAVWVMIYVATPFLLVRLERPGEWRSYAALFDAAWTMTVRYGLGVVFVGVFWLVVFLSNALFKLVGVEVIQWLLDTDWVPFGLSGAMLGLGLAVVYEMRAKVSPYLILRLLRLLVPVVLVVLVVFLGAVPVRGLSELFGEFSSGATLMGAAIVAITLVSAALDRDDRRGVHTRGLRLATRGLTLLLPLLALLAVWAVGLRVRQYGWTPDRLMASTVAGFVLAYGVGYAFAALRGGAWAGRVRQVNVVLALAIIAVMALWMTPALNPHRISANSQVARYLSGDASLDQLPLWSLQHEWGRSGQAQIARIEGMSDRDDHAALVARIAVLREESSKYRFNQAMQDIQTPDALADLTRLMAMRPEGASLPMDLLANLPVVRMIRWRDGCNLALPDGRPGCVMIRGSFASPRQGEAQAMVLFLNKRGEVRVNHVLWSEDGEVTFKNVFGTGSVQWEFLSVGALTRVLDGDYDIRPSGTNALFIGNTVLVPGN